MSKIINPIPPQGFEIVRDRIADILIDELASQAVLCADPELNINVFLERFNTLDKSEFPAANIALATGAYDNENMKTVDGTYTYYVDFYSSSKTTTERSDTLANKKLQKYLGKARAIFKNPVYKTLGFAPPFISKVTVATLDINPPTPTNDADSSVEGRLSITVRLVETTELIEAVLIAGYETKIKIGETNKGYYYKGGV
ncbi:MAG: hypothetical protein H7282_05075 [Cytophagaceae bacterium]|nr:hypothetical protein [Cytophagaceae bacterium]